MFSRSVLFYTLLTITTTTTFASPVDRELVGIQCSCLSLSTKNAPSPCTILGFQNYNWPTAQYLASKHNLKLEFASQTTISKALSIDHPPPASALRAIAYGEADLSPRKGTETEDKMICGHGDEVRKMSGYGMAEPESHGLGQIIGIFMLLVIGYAAGEYVWIRYHKGNIKLDGGERDFTSTVDMKSTTSSIIPPSHVDVQGKDIAAPLNFS